MGMGMVHMRVCDGDLLEILGWREGSPLGLASGVG